MSKTAKDTTYMNRALARTGGANRAQVTAFLDERGNQGVGGATLYNYASALRQLDEHLAGRPIGAATAEDLRDFLTDRRERGLQAGLFQISIEIRAYLRWLHQSRDLPHDIDQATYVKMPPRTVHGRVLRDEEFSRLLEAAGRTDGPGAKWARPERTQAVFWTLWDSGFRASELLSLNVGSVEFDGLHGARLVLPAASRARCPLKTGPRTVYVVECVGPLRVWIDLHPAGDDSGAPLFPAAQPWTGRDPLRYQALHMLLKRAANAAGINDQASVKDLTSHDFRHTRATRAARAGWMEAELRKFFGWRDGSHMPAIYVHLALEDMRDRVRRDAGVDELGYAKAMEVGDEVEQLKALLRKIVAEPGNRTRRP